MLNIDELYKLLDWNEVLTQIELQRETCETKRLLELTFHRLIIKDCIIELQQRQLEYNRRLKAA